jgi:hypothetical protein
MKAVSITTYSYFSTPSSLIGTFFCYNTINYMVDDIVYFNTINTLNISWRLAEGGLER